MTEKFFFTHAFLLLGIMQLAILLFPIKRLTASLSHKQKIDRLESLNKDEARIALQISKAINRAGTITPWHSTCLAQALTAHRMLYSQNIPGAFYLGVKKNNSTNTKMAAHAWSQCDDKIITGEKGHESFTVVSVFIWNKQ